MYINYMMKYSGGYKLLISTQLIMLVLTASRIYSIYVLGHWTNQEDQH